MEFRSSDIITMLKKKKKHTYQLIDLIWNLHINCFQDKQDQQTQKLDYVYNVNKLKTYVCP